MGTDSKKLECDLVIGGGITSGISIHAPSSSSPRPNNFRSIGGTSAGAIAAAATAAGALGVRHGKDPFEGRFKGLPKELAKELGGKTVLLRVFQPAKELTRGSWTDSFDHPGPLAKGRSPRPKGLRMMPPGSNDPSS